jgi:tetratricopeptide (TPR) repeat protein
MWLSSSQMQMICRMRFILLFSAALALSSCGHPKQGAQSEKDLKTSDSLSIKLNSPELKTVNAELLSKPNDPDLYDKRALVYLSLKEFKEAENDAKRAVKLDSAKAKYYMTLVDVYYAQNNTRHAKELLESTVKKFPENTEALLKLAELYFLVRKYQEGIDQVNKALRIDENLAKAYFIKGSIYRESGDTAKAISSLETAVEQDSKMVDAHYDLGVMYAAKKNPIALQYYENVLRIDPNHATAKFARAKLLQDLGKIDEAIHEYELIIASNNQCDICYYNLGAVYLTYKKDKEKALKYFTNAIETNRNYVQAYLARGYTYALLNNKTAAKADYNMCLQLQPNYEGAIQGLNEL